MFASILASLLSAIASFAPTIAKALGHEPIPEPAAPKAPAWGSIDEAEDAEARRRKGPIA